MTEEEKHLIDDVFSGAIKLDRAREMDWREQVVKNPVYQEIERRVVMRDLEAFCRRWYWIVDKVSRKPVLLIFNNIQKAYHAVRTRFDIILKYRKGGITTYKCAEYFHKTIFQKNTKTVILTHHRASTEEIFEEFVKKPYEMLPEFLRPAKKYDSKQQLSFPETGSSFRVGTASSRGFGAGTTPDNVHLSEAAKYDHLTRIMGDLNQAVFAGNPRAHISLESVAQGENEFFREWLFAKDGQSRFKPHFFPWFIDETNAIEPDPDESLELTPEESRLAALHDLSFGQIKFRRIKEMECKGAAPRAQEYPESDQEAFVSSGRKRFDAKVLDEWFQETLKRKIKYLDCAPGLEAYENLQPLLQKELRIFRAPVKGRHYIIGSDIARGIDPGGDYSDAVVVDRETCEEVAELHGRFEPDLWAVYLYELGLLYNVALLSPESNNDMGGVVMAHLTNGIILRGRVVYPKAYPNLYVFRYIGNPKRWAYGWHTNQASKILMINELGNYLENRGIGVNFPEFLAECRMYQIKNDGTVGAPDSQGCYDDRVMSRAIALQARKQGGPSSNPDTSGLVVW